MPDEPEAACPSALPGRQPRAVPACAGAIGTILRSILPFPLRGIDHLLLWLERARQRRVLEGSSDHMLKDMGLSRADVEAEIRKRPWCA